VGLIAERALEDHLRYLEAMLEACSRRPEVYVHTLIALARELRLARRNDLAGYMAASGDVFELTRALWLDRAASRVRIHAAVGDRRRTHAAAAEYELALRATGHRTWPGVLAEAAAAFAGDRSRAVNAAAAYTRLLLSAVALQGAAERSEIDAWRAWGLDAGRTLRTCDPRFSWSELAPEYELRTPWTAAARAAAGRWLGGLGLELEPAGERSPSEPDVRDAIAALADAQARWCAGLERTPAATPDPGLATPSGTVVVVADAATARRAAAPLRAEAEARLARAGFWPDPLVEHHWRALLAALDEAVTAAEVELISEYSAACFAIEAGWNAALLATLFGPLRAACLWEASPEERYRDGLRRAALAAYELVGLGPRALLQSPRVADFVARVLTPMSTSDPGAFGAAAGEAGFDTLLAARAWRAAARARGERDPGDPGDAGALQAALHESLDRAGIPEPRSKPLRLTLWGVEIEPDDLPAALAAPRRPALARVAGALRAGL
jgi:hypothetical protein